MSKHRSLSDALLTTEKVAFIKGHDAAETDNTTNALPATQYTSPVAESAIELRHRQPESDVQKKTSSRRIPAAPIDAAVTSVPTPASSDYLVAITTRLQAGTAHALRRAYLEQKLNRRKPATQQEIIEAAVQNWLRRYDFLD